MTSESLTLVENIKTNKRFIVLDEVHDRYRLINPEGVTVSLLIDLFHQEPVVIELANIHGAGLSDAQLASFQQYLLELQKKSLLQNVLSKTNSIEKNSCKYTPSLVPRLPVRLIENAMSVVLGMSALE